jgi:predicted amidohydrolase YtcJ
MTARDTINAVVEAVREKREEDLARLRVEHARLVRKAIKEGVPLP